MTAPLAVPVHPGFLVGTEWLAAHLNESDLRLIDCTVHIRFDPATVGPTRSSGREDFGRGHIPGAQFVDVVTELSDPTNPVPCMAPSAAQFAAAMSRMGVSDSSRVVLYSAQNAYWAARVWWLLRLFGFDNAALLDGGWQKWQREGRPVETGSASPRHPARFIIRAQRELIATKAEVLAAIGDPSVCTLNALPADQHVFTSGIHYGRPGHIAGSLNVPAEDLLNPISNEFLPLDRLRQRFESVGAFGKRVITYCGAGSAASADAMVLMMLGHTDVRLYDGSLCEWAADPSLPMEAARVPTSSDQALAGIENSRLLAELHEALAREHAMAEVLKVINSSPGDLTPVFDAMLQKALQLCDAAFGILRTYEDDKFSTAATRGVPETYAEFLYANPQVAAPGTIGARIAAGEAVVHIVDLKAEVAYSQVEPHRRASVDLGGARTTVTVPLTKDGHLVGAIQIYRQHVLPFSERQIALLQNFAAQAVVAMENARLLGELRVRTEEVAAWNRELEDRVAAQLAELERVGRLKRFLAPQIAELIVSHGDEKILESHRREIVVVFCDLRGYTAFTETAEPEEVLDFLREYHGAVGPLVSQFEGTLDQFSGDGVMVFFNDPVPIPDAAERAVKMAVAMREAAGRLIAEWRKLGRDLGFGVGIAQGYATLGQIGFSDRSGYTAIGTVCNIAARLCGEATDGQILLSQRVNVELKGGIATEQIGALALKGLTQPVVAYNVPLAVALPALRVIEGSGPPSV